MELAGKKKWRLAGLVLVGFGLVVGGLLFHPMPEDQTFQGKSLKLWAVQLSSQDPQLQREAAAVLKGIGTNAVPGLLRMLEGRDSLLRKLVWWSGPKFPRWLRSNLLARVRPPDAAAIRGAACLGLAALGPEALGAKAELVRALKSPEKGNSWGAAVALGAMGKECVPDLLAALRDSNPQVRQAAAFSLGEIGPEAGPAVPALIPLLNALPEYLQQTAARSLSNIGLPAVAALIETLAQGDGLSRKNAGAALLWYYYPGPSARKRASLPDGDQPQARREAIEKLVAAGRFDSVTVKVLAGPLKDPDLRVRLTALRALGQSQGDLRPALPRIMMCLVEKSPLVREQAAILLGQIGSPAQDALALLLTLSQDEEASVRLAATEAIARIRPGVRALKEDLRDGL